MKKRTGEPWITAVDYGQLLPSFSVNLLVREVERSIDFYRDVLEAFVHYSDPDFAAIKLAGADLMLHADHTYEDHPWYTQLASGERRGLGAELRLLGMDPDALEGRARAAGSRVVKASATKGHG